jgi:hypothetical protein
LVFGETVTGLVMIAFAVAAFAWIARSFGGGRGESVDSGRAAPVPEPVPGD